MAVRPGRFRPSRRAAKVGDLRLRYPRTTPSGEKNGGDCPSPGASSSRGLARPPSRGWGRATIGRSPVSRLLGAEEAVPTALFTGYSHRLRVSRGEHKMLWRLTALTQDDEDQSTYSVGPVVEIVCMGGRRASSRDPASVRRRTSRGAARNHLTDAPSGRQKIFLPSRWAPGRRALSPASSDRCSRRDASGDSSGGTPPRARTWWRGRSG